MLIHLDTSFLIRALVSGSPEDTTLRTWLRANARVSVSAVAWAEFLCGPLGDEDRVMARRLVGAPVPLGEAGAELAAILFNRGGRRRGTFIDCLLAAVAIRAGARLATSNPADFRQFVQAGLELA